MFWNVKKKGNVVIFPSPSNIPDNEEHRLNYCKVWEDINLCNEVEKIPFENVYSTDVTVLRNIIQKIENIWNTKSAYGTMNTL